MELQTDLRTGDNRDILKDLSKEKFRMCMTSPPYWGLRKYGKEANTVWGGDKNCRHTWVHKKRIVESFAGSGSGWLIGHEKGQKEAKVMSRAEHPENWVKEDKGSDFCSKCGAWKGQLGLEPTPDLYIKHIVEICELIKRVLTSDGSLYLVLGDTFLQGHKLGLPWRIRFALNDAGWLSRSDAIYPGGVGLWMDAEPTDIVWHKPNAMPDSAKSRLTPTNEFVFRFVLPNKEGPFWAIMRNRPDPELEPIPKKRKRKEELAVLWDEVRKWWDATPSHGVSKIKDYSTVPKKYRPAIWRLTHYFDLDAIRVPHKCPEIEYRAKLRRGKKYKGKGSPQGTVSSFHPGGKTPTDTIMFPEQQPHRGKTSIADQIRREQRNRETHQTHPLGPAPRDVVGYKGTSDPNAQPDGRSHFRSGKAFSKAYREEPLNPLGKNPGDQIYTGTKQFSKERRYELGIPSATQEERASLYHPLGANPGDFWSILTRPYEGAHFAVYPPELCERPILSSTMPGDWVLDPFMGSGTTGVEAKKLGRNFLGIDISPAYAEMARNRLTETPWGRQLNQMTLNIFENNI